MRRALSWHTLRIGFLLTAFAAPLATNAPCSAQPADQDGQQNEAPAEAAAPACAANFVIGPNGECLFRTKGPGPNSTLTFEQVARSTTEGKVINSDKSFKLTRLPATFKATLDTGEICTATLIGPRVLLTAAHCVDLKFKDGAIWQTVKGTVARSNGQGKMKILSCAMAPAYTASPPADGRVRNAHDFALCELVDEYGVRAENIVTNAAVVAAGQRLMLAGFGCTNSDLTGGQITDQTRTTGVLNVGFNAVQTANGNDWIKLEGHVGTDAAILCPGDSGGAAFSGVDLSSTGDHGWKIAAINSQVGPGLTAANPSYISYLAPLSDPQFRSFLDGWVQERRSRRKICGLQLTAATANCRT